MSVRPLVRLSRSASTRGILERDLERWLEARPLGRALAATTDEALCIYLATFAEFRNVFYYRLERGGGGILLAGKVAQRIWRPVPSFEMEACPDIGPGFVARHGYSSILAAERIGANCFVHHEVTIGWDETGQHPPRIGDDVFIGAGAKILGAVTIGDRVRIGANAVVLRDVPDGCTAVGVPARIIEPKALLPAQRRDAPA
jgi:serine O-acetyltransferase